MKYINKQKVFSLAQDVPEKKNTKVINKENLKDDKQEQINRCHTNKRVLSPTMTT